MISYGTPFDKLFADLTDRCACAVGPESEPSQRPRIVFERAGDPALVPAAYRVAGEKTIGRFAHPWTAIVYGASDLEVTERMSALAEALEELLGPAQGDVSLEELQPHTQAPMGRGYALAAGPIGVVGGDGQAAQFARSCSVTLYTRLRSQIRPLATIERVNVSVASGAGASDAVDASIVLEAP